MSRGTAADSSAEPPASNTRATNLLNAMVVDVSYLVVVSSVATCASDAGSPSTILTPTVTSVRPGDENLRTCSPRGGDPRNKFENAHAPSVAVAVRLPCNTAVSSTTATVTVRVEVSSSWSRLPAASRT